MIAEQEIIKKIAAKAESASDVFCTTDGVTLKSLEVLGINTPDIGFLESKSSIVVPVEVVLDFNNEHQAKLAMVFTSHDKITSLDKVYARSIVRGGDFFCDYEQNDPDWEFATDLKVEITTGNEDVIDAIMDYDSTLELAVGLDCSAEGDATVIVAREHLAGKVTDYFVSFISGFGAEKDNNPVLRSAIVDAMRDEVLKLL